MSALSSSMERHAVGKGKARAECLELLALGSH